jgi:hypothetical protein
MNAIYSDLQVDMRKVVVNSSSDLSRREGQDGVSRHRREKHLFVGLKVIGRTRVSGSTSEWEV